MRSDLMLTTVEKLDVGLFAVVALVDELWMRHYTLTTLLIAPSILSRQRLKQAHSVASQEREGEKSTGNARARVQHSVKVKRRRPEEGTRSMYAT